MDTIKELMDRLAEHRILDREEFCFLIDHMSKDGTIYLYERARNEVLNSYGNRIFVRDLMEFTDYCRNDCYYCGVRRSNPKAARYRLTPDRIMDCCRIDYGLGLRTFVFQGGEDPWFTDKKIAYLMKGIKKNYPDCAVTLPVGEKGPHAYKRWLDAGADRYLLRHGTASPCHYISLHPPRMSSEHRKECLRNLKATGCQTGYGIMVGAPCQTTEHIAEDLEFMYGLQPEMAGIGLFIPYHDTPFKDRPAETLRQTLLLLAIIRLMLPSILLPAITVLGTIEEDDREQGVVTGANVVIPNLSPVDVCKKYILYDNKISTGVEAAANTNELEKCMKAIGYEVVTDQDDYKKP